VICAAAALALALAPSAPGKAKGFKYGVSSGDVTSSSAILWAKAKKSGKAYLQVNEGGGFGACDGAHSLGKVKAKNGHDNTLQAQVTELDADTDYRYRFCMPSGAHSTTGKLTTAPKSKKKETIRFALSGDQDARPAPGGSDPYWGPFDVWKRIVQQRNDFNVLMGDTIYSDTEVPGYGLDDIAISVAEKRAAYKTNLGSKPWVKARSSAAYYAHWDDHEFINDFSREESSFPYSNLGNTDISGEKLYKNGVKAFRDYNPVSYSKKTGIYRSIRWGKNLEIFFLDERSFRSASSDYGGTCDNPAGSGDPDLAPTAPQETRNLFSAIAPQLANPPSQACLDSINDPNRTMLGSKQLKKFKKAIAKSTAAFKVIFNEVPIQQFYALPYDRWEGYAAEREALLHFLADNVKNVVFLTTDVHASLVDDARFNTLGGPGVQNSGILDITTGPIGTETYAGEINGTLGNPSGGTLIHDLFFKPQPPSGVGMQCAALDQDSYAEVTVTNQQLRVDLLDATNAPVQDTGEASNPGPPCAPIVIPKS
jgi:phosphodiesterase/alkaline phosphatase D-like protein